MTAPVALSDFATETGYVLRTMQTGLEALVAIGLVRIVGGGPGIKASYELLTLPRAGADPVLPLIGQARPRPPRESPAGPTLFDAPVVDDAQSAASGPDETPEDIRAYDLRSFCIGARGYLRSFCTGTRGRIVTNLRSVGRIVTNLRSFCIGWLGNLRSFCTGWLPLSGTRARATYNNLRTTTSAPVVAAEPQSRPPPCRWHGRSHAWCDGRVHVPMSFHLEERRKLARLPGQTDADLDAELFALYAAVLAGIPDSTPITDRNEFVFWKRVLRGTPTGRSWIPFRRSPPARASPARHEGVPSGTGRCPHDPRCASFTACRDRILTQAREERERRSG